MKATAGAGDESARSAKWIARRDEIIDTSARLFAERGYHATGIADLCDANGLGKGAFYHYIESKEELLAAIQDRVMDEVMAGADRVAAEGGPYTHQLERLGAEYLEVIVRLPEHVWVFLHEYPALTGRRADDFRARRRTWEQRVEQVIAAGVTAGEFRAIDPKLATRAWFGMHNYTYLWLRPDGPRSAREVSEAFAQIVLEGITAPGA
jgi:AcrR family transcriptional regulator